ncbi:MAG: helix-turn-helix transcriptional regulator [Pseudomonadota bacterium]
MMPKTLGDIRHKELVRILIQKRRDAGLRQVELAQQMKVYQSLIARLESGERRVDVVELIKLSEILSFDPAEIVRGLSSIEEPPI